MPRYFFHIKAGVDLPDRSGTELQDDEAARLEAVRASTSMIKELGINFWNSGQWTMTVMREDRVVWTMRYVASIT